MEPRDDWLKASVNTAEDSLPDSGGVKIHYVT
jgi:hypothetical protein